MPCVTIMSTMQKNEIEGPVHEEIDAAGKSPWQTPDFEELDVQATASAPPVTGGADGAIQYS